MAAEQPDILAKDFGEAGKFLTGDPDFTKSWSLASIDPETPLFKGRLATAPLACGVRMSTCDLTALADAHHQALLPRCFGIALGVEGEPAEYAIEPRARLPLLAGGALKISVADSIAVAGRYRSGQHFKSLVLTADPDTLQDPQLAEAVEAQLTGTSWKAMQAPPRALALTREMCARDGWDCVSALLLESCALELLALSLQTAPGEMTEEVASITRKDRERMSVVRDALTSAPDHPHRLAELARQAGVSVTTLKAKFPAIFGQPVFAFLRDVRMERARKGLQEEGWTVSQAAYYSGYRHTSNFSTAFQRKYRVLPSEIRCP